MTDAVVTQEPICMKTLELGAYLLDLVKVSDFKKYYYKNLDSFSNVAINSYLKAVDIPPKFFKENPIETQKELLDNREEFVKIHKKYFDKVIVVAKAKVDGSIINACRMVESEALSSYEKLKPIEQVTDKFEHRAFNKDGYITYVVSGDIKNNVDNKVLVVDFPILLNKKAVVHEALYTLPNETFATPIEHIHYLTGDEVDFESEYSDIKQAVEDHRSFLVDKLETEEAKDILREPEVVALALYEAGTISHSYVEKVANYIKDNLKGTLTTNKLESLVLDYDETVRSYKQVTALRGVSGLAVLKVLESPDFKELVDEMESAIDELDEL
jgi:hypothetical protein